MEKNDPIHLQFCTEKMYAQNSYLFLAAFTVSRIGALTFSFLNFAACCLNGARLSCIELLKKPIQKLNPGFFAPHVFGALRTNILVATEN